MTKYVGKLEDRIVKMIDEYDEAERELRGLVSESEDIPYKEVGQLVKRLKKLDDSIRIAITGVDMYKSAYDVGRKFREKIGS